MDYCVSDIHGHYDLFCRLLDKVKFSGGDKLYVLGDIIDKGADSVRLARLLFAMPNAVCIAGNHEYDFLKHYRALMSRTEDPETVMDRLRGCFDDGGLLDWETIDAMESLPFFVETDDFVGVHAGVPVEDGKPLPAAQATCEQLVYDRRFKDEDVLPQGGKCVLYGHTPVRYLTNRDEILFYPRRETVHGVAHIADYCKIHLDTGVALSGILGCLRVEDCRTFYVRER